MRFVDTNVLLYAISSDPDEAAKATAARAILESADLALSVQVLQEFYVQATRPTRQYRLSHEQASLLVEAWLRFPVQDITVPIMLAAAATAQASRHLVLGCRRRRSRAGSRLRVRTLRGPRGRAGLRRRPHREPVQSGGLTRSLHLPLVFTRGTKRESRGEGSSSCSLDRGRRSRLPCAARAPSAAGPSSASGFVRGRPKP